MAIFTTASPAQSQNTGYEVNYTTSRGETFTENNPTSTFFDNDTQEVGDTDLVNGCYVVSTKFVYIPWNNPENIISQKTTFLMVKMLMGVFVPLLAIAGIPMNILNCLVFYKLGLRERINLLLFCLAVADLITEVYLFFFTIEYFYSLLAGDFQQHGPFLTIIQNNGLRIFYGFVYVSGFISTMIACERCLCTVHPFTAKKFFKTTTTGIIVAFATAVLVGVHHLITDKAKLGCIHYLHLGVTTKGYYPGQFYLQHRKLVDILNGVVYGLFLPCFFVSVTTITTVITIIKLKTAAAWRQQMTSGDEDRRKDVAVTKMLIALSILFVACSIPNIVVRIVPMFVIKLQLGGRYQNLFMIGTVLLNATPALNACLNFFFYFQMGSKFRLTLSQLFCPFKQMTITKSYVSSITITSTPLVTIPEK